MTANVGNADRALRLVLGFIIIGLGLQFESYWGLIGFIPLITALIRWCPAYVPFKFSTVKAKSVRA